MNRNNWNFKAPSTFAVCIFSLLFCSFSQDSFSEHLLNNEHLWIVLYPLVNFILFTIIGVPLWLILHEVHKLILSMLPKLHPTAEKHSKIFEGLNGLAIISFIIALFKVFPKLFLLFS